MARYTGSALALQWVTSSGTAWLEGDFRSLSISEDQESADSTAGDDTYKGYIPTVADASGEVSLLDTSGTAGTIQWAYVAPATTGTLTWYPTGTAASQMTWAAPGFVQSRQREFPYDDVVSITLGFQFTGVPVMGSVAPA